MKRVFVCLFGVLVVMSAIAMAMQGPSSANKKSHLVWVTDDNPARRAQMRLFEQLNPGISIDIDPSNSGTDKIIVQSQAGVGPDLFDCYSKEQLSAFTESGIAWDVTSALARRGIHVSSQIWPVSADVSIVDGRVYGFPDNASVNALWLNKDLFAHAGIPLPKGSWTWRQFLPVAEKMTLRDPHTGAVEQWGLLLDMTVWPQFVYQWGGRLYTSSGARCTVDSPQAIAGIQFMHDLIYKYKVLPSPAELDAMATTGGWGSGPITLFAAGHSAMALGGRWWLVTYRTLPSLHLSAVECPYPMGGKQLYFGSARSTMINASSPKREEALKFLEFLAGQPYNQLVDQQADGLCAVKADSEGAAYLHNPEYPQEDFNDVWLKVMPYGVTTEISPFIDSTEATEIFQKQIDLVMADQKPAAAAMHDAAAQINATIRQNVARDPALQSRYASASRAQ